MECCSVHVDQHEPEPRRRRWGLTLRLCCASCCKGYASVTIVVVLLTVARHSVVKRYWCLCEMPLAPGLQYLGTLGISKRCGQVYGTLPSRLPLVQAGTSAALLQQVFMPLRTGAQKHGRAACSQGRVPCIHRTHMSSAEVHACVEHWMCIRRHHKRAAVYRTHGPPAAAVCNIKLPQDTV